MLYEMLAGKNPFKRASVFETLDAVLNATPENLAAQRVPEPLARLVMRSINKAPDERFQSALDFLWAMEQAVGAPSSVLVPKTSTTWRRSPTIFGAAALASLAAVGVWAFLPSRPSSPTGPALTRFTWQLPTEIGLGSAPVVSPDSRYVAFVGIGGKESGESTLYVRDRESSERLTMVPDSSGAQHPFWSADSKALAFFKKGRLMKVMWPRGAPVSLAGGALFPFGGAWSPSGTIVFAPDVIMAGLRRVGGSGERPAQATVLDSALGDTSHSWPVALPDGRHFLFFVRSAHDDRRGVYMGKLDAAAVHADSLLMRTDSNAVFVPTPGSAEGILLYVINGRLEARHFDTQTMKLVGDPRTIGDVAPAETTASQPAMVSASADMLVFAQTTVPYGNRLEAVDRNGKRLRLWEEPEAQNWPRLSPDGRLLARQRVDPLRNTPDVWVEDLVRGSKLRVTTAVEPNIRPVWSADGRYLAYVSGNLPFRTGKRLLNIAAADGTGVLRTMPCPGEYCEPTDWTTRGVLVNVVAGSQRDVWIVPTEKGAQAQPLLADAFAERDARLSRDGGWIAYVSEESGRPEISVRTTSEPRRRLVVSTEGGDHPVWRRDDAELFFVDPQGQLMSVSVQWGRGQVPVFGLPAKINVPPIGRGHWGTPYDVSPDGRSFYLLRRNDDPRPREIHVVLGWRTLLN
jgi:Tol biopolymer transport system component